MIITGTAMSILSDNVFRRMLMTPIRKKYLTDTNPTDICYRIPTNIIDSSFSSISNFMDAQQRVIVEPFPSNFNTRLCRIQHINICLLSSIEDKESKLYTSAVWSCMAYLRRAILDPVDFVSDLKG